jgi:voltage-gated potassium channel Kch
MSSDSRPTTTSASLRERLHYAFDRSISRGPMALIAWLAVVSGLLVAAISFLVWLLALAPAGDAGARPGFLEIAWASLMRTLDPGTMGGDRGSWPFLFSMLAVTLGGIFVISTLIGVLTTGINERLDELRKGRSKVIESGHTVILGWSPQVFTIVSELVEASRNQKRSCVVVLGPEDKVEMEDRLRERVADWGRTRVVCRRGDPTDVTDLEIAGIHAARSIIVLAPPGDAPDSAVIKTLLAITNHPNRRAEPYHVVAEIHDPRNLEVARMVGKAEVELVLVPDLLSRITVQTCRQSGLSVAYLELLDFGGDEIYFHEEPGLVGKTFGEALLAYEDSSVIGLRPREGGTLVNPKMDRRIEAGDKVIAISEDDDTVRLSGLKNLRLNQNAIQKLEPAARTPERTLVLGWNERVPMIVRELDQYVAAGSAVHVVAAREEGDAALQAEVGALQNQTLAFTAAEPTHRGALDALDIPSYHHVILLTNEGLPEQEADARTLITLLHLREIAETASRPFSIVSEMLDPRNRVLAEVARADDFIVGNRLVALLLAQVSENKELNAVFQDLFDPDGSEIYLKLASNYVTIGKPVNFYTVVESARRRGEIAIGYRIKAQSGDASNAYGVRVNPKKSKSVTFAEWDRIIVIAED